MSNCPIAGSKHARISTAGGAFDIFRIYGARTLGGYSLRKRCSLRGKAMQRALAIPKVRIGIREPNQVLHLSTIRSSESRNIYTLFFPTKHFTKSPGESRKAQRRFVRTAVDRIFDLDSLIIAYNVQLGVTFLMIKKIVIYDSKDKIKIEEQKDT